MRVNRQEFLQKLEVTEPGLSPKGIIQQTDAYIFKGGQLITYNDEVCVRVSSGLPADFEAAVSSRPLREMFRKLAEDELVLQAGEGELIIDGNKRRTGILMEAKITLKFDKLEEPTSWAALTPDFLDAVNMVQECASKNENHQALTCIHIHKDWVEACDNVQLCRYNLPTGIDKPTVVKQEAIKHVVPLSMTEIAITDNWLHFRNPAGVLYSCRRYIEAYPDLAVYLKAEAGLPAVLPKGLIEACDKANVFTSEKGEDNEVLVEVRSGKVRLKGQGNTGWFSEVKNMTYEGPPVQFYVSPNLLIQITQRWNECIINSDQLRVNGGKFVYLTCLGKPDE